MGVSPHGLPEDPCRTAGAMLQPEVVPRAGAVRAELELGHA